MVIGVIRIIMVIIVIRVNRGHQGHQGHHGHNSPQGPQGQFIINLHQSAFKSQKDKLYILAEMLKISKSGCCADVIYIIDHHHF